MADPRESERHWFTERSEWAARTLLNAQRRDLTPAGRLLRDALRARHG